MRRLFFFFFIFISALSGKLSAQIHEADSLVRTGDLLHESYDFGRAVEAYEDALAILEDTLTVSYDSLKVLSVRDRLILSENGRSMSSFSYSPTVIARHKFGIDDFFLYYPLPDRSWRALPNPLDTAAVGGLSRALYAPEGAGRIYYSAEDNEGIRNIYMTEHQDSVWTCPALLNEHTTSSSDEIYPMLSTDGRTMYFSSKGLYGVGGFDIYVSEWSDENNDWSVPVNMGFPYSSPADDFLFINTEDGEHTIFASNRDCGADSVWVYVLEFDNMPVRRVEDDPVKLKEISCLVPADASLEETDVTAAMPEHVDRRRYEDKMAEVRALRDSLSNYGTFLDEDRNRFALSNDDGERMRLTGDILRRESHISQFQDSLDRAVAELQEIQMEFLFSGVVIDLDDVLEEADREVVGEATSYAFMRMNMGDTLDMRIMEPEKKFDYSFMILDEGQFAEDNTIPGGVVYQIQMFSSGRKATVAELRGLSPVFVGRSSNGLNAYRVGLFNTYKDVLSKLNAVKKAGFRGAFIVAFVDGKEVSVAAAREKEGKMAENRTLYQVEIIPYDGVLEPEMAEGIRQQSSGRDLARSESEDGTISYVAGPFDDKGKAEAVMEFVNAMGLGKVSCVPVVNENVNQ